MTHALTDIVTKRTAHEDGTLYWTLRRYHRMVNAGVLGPEDKVELLRGKLIEKLSINPPHASTMSKLQKLLVPRLFGKYELRYESPITLFDDSEPEPDCVVAELSENSYENSHPTGRQIFLLVEVASVSLTKDRTVKMKLYAESGIPEYWIINLREGKLEVHLRPDPRGGTYGSLTHYLRDSVFTSPFVGEVTVNDLVPEVLPEEEE